MRGTQDAAGHCWPLRSPSIQVVSGRSSTRVVLARSRGVDICTARTSSCSCVGAARCRTSPHHIPPYLTTPHRTFIHLFTHYTFTHHITSHLSILHHATPVFYLGGGSVACASLAYIQLSFSQRVNPVEVEAGGEWFLLVQLRE